jgi:peptidyl-prolyl cis-trans isomerase B (cyclophilin B)
MKTIKAQIEFENGKTINAELYPETAPLSVDNFVSLAQSGFYNGLCFHRVIPGFMVQGGGFVAGEKGKLKHKDAPKTVKGEFKSNGVENNLSHTPGVLSMARTSVPDSASSQFFICVGEAKYLDGQYAAFGKTSDGESLKTAVAISNVRTLSAGGFDDVPVQPIVIKTIRILA